MNDDRFARHHLIDGWQQEQLTNACVIIIGIGALGNEVARLLALSGVGSLTLCDPDRVSVSNLSRCGLFTEKDIDQFKVDVAAQHLIRLAPDIHIQTRLYPLIEVLVSLNYARPI